MDRIKELTKKLEKLDVVLRDLDLLEKITLTELSELLWDYRYDTQSQIIEKTIEAGKED